MSIVATILSTTLSLGIGSSSGESLRFPITVDAQDYIAQLQGRWCNIAGSLWVFDDMVVIGKRSFWASYRLDLTPDGHQELVVDYQIPDAASFRLRLDRGRDRLMRYRAWSNGRYEYLGRCSQTTAEVSLPPPRTASQ